MWELHECVCRVSVAVVCIFRVSVAVVCVYVRVCRVSAGAARVVDRFNGRGL